MWITEQKLCQQTKPKTKLNRVPWPSVAGLKVISGINYKEVMSSGCVGLNDKVVKQIAVQKKC